MSQNHSKNVVELPISEQPGFSMIDVGRKRATQRRAVASGTIYLGPLAYEKVKTRTLPKGDALALAEIAGITGAKKTPDLIPLCHPLPLDQVNIYTELNDTDHSVTAYCLATCFAKTGVEMEAVAGVNAALLTIWDLAKGTDPALHMSDIRLLVKEGGKSGLWVHPDGIPNWLAEQLPDEQTLPGVSAAILVMSDRASAGTYEDRSGPVISGLLTDKGASVSGIVVIPDDSETIKSNVDELRKTNNPDLIILSGGTGPGPRDVTPETLKDICDKTIPGFGELLRSDGANFTKASWLSRSMAGVIGETLIIALPGSPKAVNEGLDALLPILPHALHMVKGDGHE